MKIQHLLAGVALCFAVTVSTAVACGDSCCKKAAKASTTSVSTTDAQASTTKECSGKEAKACATKDAKACATTAKASNGSCCATKKSADKASTSAEKVDEAKAVKVVDEASK